jgi:hypothetical protein
MAQIQTVALELFEGIDRNARRDLNQKYREAEQTYSQAQSSEGKEAAALYKTALASFLSIADAYGRESHIGATFKAIVLGFAVGNVATSTISMFIKKYATKSGKAFRDAKKTFKQSRKDEESDEAQKEKWLESVHARKKMREGSPSQFSFNIKDTDNQAFLGGGVGAAAGMHILDVQIKATAKLLSKRVKDCSDALEKLGETASVERIQAAASKAAHTLNGWEAKEAMSYTSGLEAALALGLTGLEAKIYARAYEEVEEILEAEEPEKKDDEAESEKAEDKADDKKDDKESDEDKKSDDEDKKEDAKEEEKSAKDVEKAVEAWLRS